METGALLLRFVPVEEEVVAVILSTTTMVEMEKRRGFDEGVESSGGGFPTEKRFGGKSNKDLHQ